LPVYSIDMPSTYSAEDDYGDDFEDYDDDFCEVELQAPAPPSKQQMSTLTGASKKKSTPGRALGDLEAIQDAVKNENSGMANRAARVAATAAANDIAAMKETPASGRETKGLKSGKASKSAGTKQAKYVAAGSAIPLGSLSTTNLAVRRAQALRARLALVSEWYAAFDQPPLTEHQLYRLKLRSATASSRERVNGARCRLTSLSR